jgi:hypothetical protein
MILSSIREDSGNAMVGYEITELATARRVVQRRLACICVSGTLHRLLTYPALPSPRDQTLIAVNCIFELLRQRRSPRFF